MTDHTRGADFPDAPDPDRPLLLQTAEVDIRERHVGEMDNVAYLLTCRATGAQLLVDAAAESERLLALIREGSPSGRLDLVVTTHEHSDHTGALATVVGATGARTVAGAGDADAISRRTGVPIDVRLDDGDLLRFGDQRLEAIELRGHTPGSIALVLRGHDEDGASLIDLFTGDSLFPGGVGNTWGDADRFASLYRDVVARIFDRLPDDTRVHPGHGAGTTLGAERPHLAEWRERGW